MRLYDVVGGAEREDPGDELAIVRLFRGDDGPEVGELGENLVLVWFFSCSLGVLDVKVECRAVREGELGQR